MITAHQSPATTPRRRALENISESLLLLRAEVDLGGCLIAASSATRTVALETHRQYLSKEILQQRNRRVVLRYRIDIALAGNRYAIFCAFQLCAQILERCVGLQVG